MTFAAILASFRSVNGNDILPVYALHGRKTLTFTKEHGLQEEEAYSCVLVFLLALHRGVLQGGLLVGHQHHNQLVSHLQHNDSVKAIEILP